MGKIVYLRQHYHFGRRRSRCTPKPYEKPQPGHRVQIDVKFIQPLPGPGARKPKKYYQFTAIDDCTRLRVLRIYDRCNQQTAIQFLDYLLERLPFRVEVIQTDNGARVPVQLPLAAGMVAVFLRRGPWGYIHARHPDSQHAALAIDSLEELPDLLVPAHGTRARG